MDKLECQEYLAQGRVLLGQEQYEEALKILMLQEKNGDDELALRSYMKAIHKDSNRPDVFEGYHLRFLVMEELGELDEAEKIGRERS